MGFILLVHLWLYQSDFVFVRFCRVVAAGNGAGRRLLYVYVAVRYLLSTRVVAGLSLLLVLYLLKTYAATAPQTPPWLTSYLTIPKLDAAIGSVLGFLFVWDAVKRQLADQMIKLFQVMACEVQVIKSGQQRDALRKHLDVGKHKLETFKYPDNIKEFLKMYSTAAGSPRDQL